MKLQVGTITHSLAFKIFALFWLAFGLLLLLALFVSRFDARLYSDLDAKELKFYHQEIMTTMHNKKFARLLFRPESFSIEDGQYVYPILVDSDKNIIGAKKEKLPFIREFIMHSDDVLSPKRKSFNYFSLAGPFSIHLTNEGKQENYSVYFIADNDQKKEIIIYIFEHPLLLISMLLLISIPILAWLAYNLAKPIHRLQIAANAVAVGNFEVNKDLETKGVVELRQVGKSFNNMSQSLGDLIFTQRKWMSAVSHELRTPLTRLQLAAALIRRKMGDSNELLRIELEIERLNKMIGDLLLLSRNQAQNAVARKNINLPMVWKNVLDGAAFEAEQMHINMNVKVLIKKPENYWINGNLDGLESAIENVIRNALKYTRSDVDIIFSIKNQYFFIQIDDNGDGVEEKEYLRIFNPFYRVDEHRTKINEGAGLGLALVQSTIQTHQGEVWAEKSPLGGLRINIKLPVLKFID